MASTTEPQSTFAQEESDTIISSTKESECNLPHKGSFEESDTIMAGTKEPQCTLPQEGPFEVVEYSDADGHQCKEATAALTEMESKVHDLERRLGLKRGAQKVGQDFCMKLAFLTPS